MFRVDPRSGEVLRDAVGRPISLGSGTGRDHCVRAMGDRSKFPRSACHLVCSRVIHEKRSWLTDVFSTASSDMKPGPVEAVERAAHSQPVPDCRCYSVTLSQLCSASTVLQTPDPGQTFCIDMSVHRYNMCWLSQKANTLKETKAHSLTIRRLRTCSIFTGVSRQFFQQRVWHESHPEKFYERSMSFCFEEH